MATREHQSVQHAVVPPEQVRTTSKWRPIHYWSAFGAAAVIVQVYAFAAWIISGDAHRQPTGADPVPGGVQMMGWVLQAISVIAALTVVLYIWRRTRREGKLAWDALIAIAFAGVYWQDTICNYARPIFFYNSTLFNFGAWNPHIPGWLSPNAANIPEPILMIGPLYAWWFVLFGIVFCAMARKMREYRPNISKVTIFVTGVVVLGVMDLVLENIFIRSQLFAYSGVINELSFYAGTIYQFPVYEALIVGVFCSIVGMVRLNRDDRGRSVIERGVDELQVGSRAKTTLRVLAMLGLSNFMFFVLNFVYIWIGCYVDPMPHYPSYLNNDMCGTAVSPPCPGPGVPIQINPNPHRA
jgi:Spirocyclase AveC-like